MGVPLLHPVGAALQLLNGIVHPGHGLLAALAEDAAGGIDGELRVLDAGFAALVKPLAHPVHAGGQLAVVRRPVHLNNLVFAHKGHAFVPHAALEAFTAQTVPAGAVLLFQPVGAVGGDIGHAHGVGAQPDLATGGCQQVIVHPEENLPGGFFHRVEGILHRIAVDFVDIAVREVFAEGPGLHRPCQGDALRFLRPLNGRQGAVLKEAEGIRAGVGDPLPVGPDGAEGDLLLGDDGLPLREEETAVLIQAVGRVPAGNGVMDILAVAAGVADIPQIIVHPVGAVGLGDLLHPGDPLPCLVCLIQVHGIADGEQGIQSRTAPGQGSLLLGGQRLPVDAEGCGEVGGVRIAAEGLGDPVVPRRQGAENQRPVNRLGEIVDCLIPGLGKADAVVLRQGILPGQAIDRLPGGAVPFVQPVVSHGDAFGDGGKPLLHCIDHGAAGGRCDIHENGDTPVRVGLQLRQRLGGEGCRVEAAVFPQLGGAVLHRAGHQTQRHKGDGHDPQQADPEAGLAVVQHGLDAVFHADLAEGHGAGRIVDMVGATVQQRPGIGLPLLQLHELHHPLVAGHFHILAQQHIAQPHQGIEPMQRQGQKTDELDPVVALVQMGALVGQDLLAGIILHPGGDIDLRLQKAQNEGSLDPVRLPSAGHLHRIHHLPAQMQIGNHAVNHDAHCQCDPHNQKRLRQIHGYGDGDAPRLQAEAALQRKRQQQPDPRQHPQVADEFLRCLPQHQTEHQHRQNHDAAMEAGGQYVLKKGIHDSSSRKFSISDCSWSTSLRVSFLLREKAAMKAGMEPSKVSSTISSSRAFWASSLEISDVTMAFSFLTTPRSESRRITV